MPKTDKLSQLQTLASLRRSSVSRWSSTTSLEDTGSPKGPLTPAHRLNKKIRRLNSSRKRKTTCPTQSTITFLPHGSVNQLSFPCYQEDDIIVFAEGVKPKFKRLTEDFDVESSDELIADAVACQQRKIYKAFGKPKAEERA